MTTAQGVGARPTAVAGGIVATEAAAAGAAAGAEVPALAGGAGAVGLGARYFGRVDTTAARSARCVPLAGGLLSAACVVVEGRELRRALARFREGDPCARVARGRDGPAAGGGGARGGVPARVRAGVGRTPEAGRPGGRGRRRRAATGRGPRDKGRGGPGRYFDMISVMETSAR